MTESQRIANIYAKQHKLYEKRIRPLFLKALQLQVQPVIQWIEAFQTINPPIDALVPVEIFRLPYKRAFEMIGITAAKREYSYMKGSEEKAVISFLVDAWKKIFDEYAINYAYQIENELTETSKEAIRDVLKQAYQEGWNANVTITALKRSVQGKISRFRASLIARTESTTISNYAKEVGAREWLQEVGQDGYKEWVGRNDARERHSHLLLNGTIIPIDESFEMDGVPANAPGDIKLPARLRVQCRCTLLFMSARRYERLTRS